MLVGVLAVALLGPTPSPPRVTSPKLSPSWQRAAAPAPALVDRDERARQLGLRPRGDGYERIREPGDRFDARIDADGRVVFDVDPTVQMKLDGVCVVAICVGGKKAEPRKTDRRKKAARGVAMAAAMLTEAALVGSAAVGPYGYGTPKSGPIPGSALGEPPPIPLAGVVGRYGYLPAPVKAMSEFLDDTFELRLEMARAQAERDLADAAKQHERSLAALWASDATAADKRAAVLQRWAELDATTPRGRDTVLVEAVESSLDARRATAAAEAREDIVASVRQHAPPGSPEAFTAVELAAFNRATTGAPFCPYEAERCPGAPTPQSRSAQSKPQTSPE